MAHTHRMEARVHDAVHVEIQVIEPAGARGRGRELCARGKSARKEESLSEAEVRHRNALEPVRVWHARVDGDLISLLIEDLVLNNVKDDFGVLL